MADSIVNIVNLCCIVPIPAVLVAIGLDISNYPRIDSMRDKLAVIYAELPPLPYRRPFDYRLKLARMPS